MTMMAFPRVQARFIRINQTGTAQNGEAWGIQQVRVYAVRGTSLFVASAFRRKHIIQRYTS